MDCSTLGLPVHHQLPELAQTHVHLVSDAIQPSYPVLSPSPPAFHLAQHQGLFFFYFNFIFKLYIIVLVLPNIKMNPLQVYFSNESALHIRWPKYCSFSFRITPSNEYLGLISFRIDWSKRLSRVFSNTTTQKPQFFAAQLSL